MGEEEEGRTEEEEQLGPRKEDGREVGEEEAKEEEGDEGEKELGPRKEVGREGGEEEEEVS